MAKVSRLAGSTSHILMVFIQDATSTAGAGLTGLASGSSGLACYYKRNRGATSVAVTLVTVPTLGTYVSGGFKEVDPVNLPGFYEFHPPDAAVAAGAGSVAFLLRGATNMVPCPVEIELTGVDNQDGVRFGLTALPNAAAGAGGGLPTGDGSGRVLLQPAQPGVTIPVVTTLTTAPAITAINGQSPPTNWNLMAVDGSGRVTTAPASNTAVAQAVLTDTTDALGADVLAIKAQTDKFAFTGSNVNAAVAAYASGQDPAALVLDAAGAGHNGVGSIGAKINAAGSAGDPLANPAPGSYAAGTAGYLIGRNLDAPVSTRSTYAGGAVASVTAPVTAGTVTDKTGYGLAATGLDAIPVETGVNARQALSPILAAAAGALGGAGTGTVTIKGGNVATTRITATTDSSGNRTAVTLALPA